jgi:hypothetical protein
MSEKRLFMGHVALTQPGVTHNAYYCDWLGSEDEARGSWVAHAMARHNGATVANVFVQDITGIAGTSARPL